MDMDGNLVRNKLNAMTAGFFYVIPYRIKVDFSNRHILDGKTDGHAMVARAFPS